MSNGLDPFETADIKVSPNDYRVKIPGNPDAKAVADALVEIRAGMTGRPYLTKQETVVQRLRDRGEDDLADKAESMRHSTWSRVIQSADLQCDGVVADE